MPCVLIVDDEPAVARGFKRSLLSLGWKVLIASNPAEAALFQESADVILTDWIMPGGGGAAVVENALRPVVIVSGTPGDVPDDLETPVLSKGAVTAEEIDGALRRAMNQNTNRRKGDQ